MDSFPDSINLWASSWPCDQIFGHVIGSEPHETWSRSIFNQRFLHMANSMLPSCKLQAHNQTLFKSASTNTPFCVSILSNPIFTVIFLKGSSLFGIPACTIQLASIAILLQEPSQGLPDSLSLLNYLHCSNCPYIQSPFSH